MVIRFMISRYTFNEYAGSNQAVYVGMFDGQKGRGQIIFIKNYSGKINIEVTPEGYINAYMPLEKLHPTLDILRNEKPVYFTVFGDNKRGILTTNPEPNGEEET